MPQSAIAQLSSLGQHVSESLFSSAVPERVQHRHAACKVSLHIGAAGVGKAHFSNIISDLMACMFIMSRKLFPM